MPSLRGHHLICLHFFSGEGYDAEFIKNLRNILKLTESEPIQICTGPDDICVKCPYLKDNQCKYQEDSDREIKEMDSMALRLLRLSPGTDVTWTSIRKQFPEIFPKWYRSYCRGCDWKAVCEKADFFQGL